MLCRSQDKPLHSTEITKLALKEGLWSEGKTPEMTMYADLVKDINIHKEKSRFIKTSPDFDTTRGIK